jgi:hypothetical protein
VLTLLASIGVPAAARAASHGSTAPAWATTVFKGGGGEPNVSISPDGKTVLVDGLGGDAQGNDQPSALWRSTDGGVTFTRIRPHFDEVGGGDFDMRWIDDHTVIAADLSLGTGIYVDRSTDGGLHWTTTTIDEDVYDRPWLAVWKQHVYVVAKGFDGVPYCYVSDDGGKSFDPLPIPIYGTGVVPAEAGGESPTPPDIATSDLNAYVDHAMTDPRTGDLYVVFGTDSVESWNETNPIGVPNRLYVARLVDGPAGQQFDVHPVSIGGADNGFIDGFNWLTIDSAGTLYVLGNGLHDGHHSAWLSYSRDHGVHWSKLVDVAEGPGANVYGAIAAGRPGTLGMVYLHGTKNDPNQQQPWYVETARITGADTASPHVERSRPVAKPIHTKDICMSGILCGAPGFGDNRDLLDYIWGVVSPSGDLFAVTASDGPATGGRGVDVVLVRQTGGPSLGTGAPS